MFKVLCGNHIINVKCSNPHMKYYSDFEDKTKLIQTNFAGLKNQKIKAYEYCQLWCREDKEWTDWEDMPLFLTIGNRTLSISWQKFDELAIEIGRVIPCSLAGSTVRWLEKGYKSLDSILGSKLKSVSLGQGEMIIDNQEVEVWTRLLLKLENESTIEIFNNLDENGIHLHHTEIIGNTIKCI